MQIIETERLILRPFREGDAADLFAYLRAPTAPCFLSLKLADLAGAEAEVRKRTVDEGSVAICLKQTGQVIGDLFGGAGDEENDVHVITRIQRGRSLQAAVKRLKRQTSTRGAGWRIAWCFRRSDCPHRRW